MTNLTETQRLKAAITKHHLRILETEGGKAPSAAQLRAAQEWFERLEKTSEGGGVGGGGPPASAMAEARRIARERAAIGRGAIPDIDTESDDAATRG